MRVFTVTVFLILHDLRNDLSESGHNDAVAWSKLFGPRTRTDHPHGTRVKSYFLAAPRNFEACEYCPYTHILRPLYLPTYLYYRILSCSLSAALVSH